MAQAIQHVECLSVAAFIDELTPAARLDASAHGIRLAVVPVPVGVAVKADRQVLAAVVGNLLQNAFKFTQPRTTVTLRVSASAERVLIEVQDECLGLPEGKMGLGSRSADGGRGEPRPADGAQPPVDAAGYKTSLSQ